MLELSWTKIKLIVSLSAFISIKQNSRQNSSFQKILHLQTVSIAVVRFDVQRTLKFQRLSNSVRELAKLTNFSRTNFEILSNLPLSHQRKLFAILISLCLRFVQTCRKYFCSSARERESSVSPCCRSDPSTKAESTRPIFASVPLQDPPCKKAISYRTCRVVSTRCLVKSRDTSRKRALSAFGITFSIPACQSRFCSDGERASPRFSRF